MQAVTRNLVIFGMILLAALLPLAAIPVDVEVGVDSLIAILDVVPFAGADAQPVALLALTFFRAPPAR